MSEIPFKFIDWTSIKIIEYRGESGTSLCKTIQFPGLRIRLVEYSNGYLADHWCQKGHFVHCVEGDFILETSPTEHVNIKKGDSFIVSDDLGSHRIFTQYGTTLLIVDGDFLK